MGLFWTKEKDMIVIAGLGNPTGKYEKTRHNVGFDCIDVLSEQYHIPLDKRKFKAEYGIGTIDGHKVLLMKPLTFMNLSGESIAPMCSYYKADPEKSLIVLYDDINLAPGNIRVRAKGSAGGHNGMKSIILRTGTENFSRVRIGVGEKPQGWDLADYVLSRFSKEDRALVEDAFDKSVDAVCLMLDGNTEEAMNKYNRKNG
jgi:PTH1 family peptidyl-tRNA hydrolase